MDDFWIMTYFGSSSRVGWKIYVKEREEVPLEAEVGNGVMGF